MMYDESHVTSNILLKGRDVDKMLIYAKVWCHICIHVKKSTLIITTKETQQRKRNAQLCTRSRRTYT